MPKPQGLPLKSGMPPDIRQDGALARPLCIFFVGGTFPRLSWGCTSLPFGVSCHFTLFSRPQFLPEPPGSPFLILQQYMLILDLTGQLIDSLQKKTWQCS